MSLSRREALLRLAPKEVVLHEGAETGSGEKVFDLHPPHKDKVVFFLFLDVGAAVTIQVENRDAKTGKDELVLNFGSQTADAEVWKYPNDYETNKIIADSIKITWDKACTFTLTAHV